jgi:hypothetical protein
MTFRGLLATSLENRSSMALVEARLPSGAWGKSQAVGERNQLKSLIWLSHGCSTAQKSPWVVCRDVSQETYNKIETPIHDKLRELVTWECKEHGVKSWMC